MAAGPAPRSSPTAATRGRNDARIGVGGRLGAAARRFWQPALAAVALAVWVTAPAGAPAGAVTQASPNGPAAAARPSGAAWWVPPLGNQPWQWELSHPLNLHNRRDMGTDDRLPDGRLAPAPVVYDIDGIINPASTVDALHRMGKRVVCYVEVGAAGNYYTAAQEGVPVTYFRQLRTAGVFGRKVPGYPERYLDLRSTRTVAIVEAMIDHQCAAKRFDAVETDIDEEYADHSGLPLTKEDEEAYMTTLAGYLHRLGLGWWIKNPDDTGDSYASDMYPLADAVLTEQCNQYSSCGLLSAYMGHKAVFNAEYRLPPLRFCPADDARGFNGARFNVGLTGLRSPCR